MVMDFVDIDNVRQTLIIMNAYLVKYSYWRNH